jgi:hypothetical protein
VVLADRMAFTREDPIAPGWQDRSGQGLPLLDGGARSGGDGCPDARSRLLRSPPATQPLRAFLTTDRIASMTSFGWSSWM